MQHCVIQDWVIDQTLMMQSVLLASVRGPDGIRKDHVSKNLVRWLRRCILVSAFDKAVLTEPFDKGRAKGGAFTGPSVMFRDNIVWQDEMNEILQQYLDTIDELPLHFHLHFLHAAEIIGYKHPDAAIRDWWNHCYLVLVNDLHLNPETEEELNVRLGDTERGWLQAQNV